MGCSGKDLVSVLILIMAISSVSLLMVKSASAQSIPMPSTPNFTLKFVTQTYYVAPTTTIDPYTGNTVILQPGYYGENQSIEIRIENQPFTPFSVNGSEVYFWYQIQFKGHYSTDWQTYWSPIPNSEPTANIPRSKGDYTIISVSTHNNEVGSGSVTDFPDGGTVDFQVEATIGYYTATNNDIFGLPPTNFHGEGSNWSNTQSITINYDSNSAASTTSSTGTPSSLTSTPTVLEFPSISIIIAFLITATLLGVVLMNRKTKNCLISNERLRLKIAKLG